MTESRERDESVALHLAPASLAEAPEIAAVLEDVQRWLAQRGIAQWARQFGDDWIAARVAAGEFWIARHDGQAIAVVRLLWADPLFWQERDRGDAAYVHTLAVRRAYAGRGIGTQLLRWAERQARAHDRSALRLDCDARNPALVRYYERAGFTPVARQHLGLWAVMLLEKPLDR